MQMMLDAQNEPLVLTLGEWVIPVDDYELRAETPVRSRTLCNGNVMLYLLKQQHVTLTVSGRAVKCEGEALCRALRDAMSAQTPFSFLFAGGQFADTRITALTYSTKSHRKITDYTVTLTGIMKEAENL